MKKKIINIENSACQGKNVQEENLKINQGKYTMDEF